MKIRIYLKETLEIGKIVYFSKDQTHYFKNVLKLESGAEIFIFNENDGEFSAKIIFESKVVSGKLINLLRLPEKKKVNLHLAFSLIKNASLSEILDKCTQIGVSSFTPLITKHSSVHHFAKERAEKIIIEASEQSERVVIPTVAEVKTLEKFLYLFKDKKIIFCDEKADITSHNILNVEINEDTFLLIGPEGGFSETEREEILKLPNVQRVSLGENILRAETACVCASFLLNLKL